MNEEMNQEQQEPVQLSLQDIATFVQIVDIASRRGAFEGRELQGVGTLRNKVEVFLNQQAQANGAQAEGQMAPADVPDGPMSEKVMEKVN
jgi:hypothetical protein